MLLELRRRGLSKYSCPPSPRQTLSLSRLGRKQSQPTRGHLPHHHSLYPEKVVRLIDVMTLKEPTFTMRSNSWKTVKSIFEDPGIPRMPLGCAGRCQCRMGSVPRRPRWHHRHPTPENATVRVSNRTYFRGLDTKSRGISPADRQQGGARLGGLFGLLVVFPNSKPYAVQQNIKVFPWKIPAVALQNIIGKYGAIPSSTLPPNML